MIRFPVHPLLQNERGSIMESKMSAEQSAMLQAALAANQQYATLTTNNRAILKKAHEVAKDDAELIACRNAGFNKQKSDLDLLQNQVIKQLRIDAQNRLDAAYDSIGQPRVTFDSTVAFVEAATVKPVLQTAGKVGHFFAGIGKKIGGYTKAGYQEAAAKS